MEERGFGGEDDEEMLEFLGNQLLAYGGGVETDYSCVGGTTDTHVMLQPEYGSKKQNMSDVLQLFYEDVVDLYWLNSSWPAYKNFFEYPTNRYFNSQQFASKYKLYLAAQRLSFGGEFFIFAPRYVSKFLLPPTLSLFWGASWDLLFGFLCLVFLSIIALIVNLFPGGGIITLF